MTRRTQIMIDVEHQASGTEQERRDAGPAVHSGLLPRLALALALFAAPAAQIWADGAGDSSERGPTLLAPFKQQMMEALKAGLAEGPVAAIEACAVEAPAIASSLSVDGVRLGRTTHRPRNLANAGPEWAAEVLRGYLETGDWAPRTVALDGGRIGYVEPIRTQAMCLLCHGEKLGLEVEAEIRQRYPQDQATGFAEGDLRGGFWVSYPEP
jgi:hypothetical protein